MSWELQAFIDLDDSSSGATLASAFVESFGPALAKLECGIYGPGYTCFDQPITSYRLDPAANHESMFRQIVAELRGADQYLEIEAGLGLDNLTPLRTPIYLYLFGSRHVGLEHARQSDASIYFCNRQRYKGSDKSITGEVVDEHYLVRLLSRICDQAAPRSLYVDNEEGSRVPFNYHMVYHNSYDGFREDLREIARVSLWGGQGYYTDDRDTYEPLLSPDVNPMLFCRRRDTRLSDLTGFLRERIGLLEAIAQDRIEIPEEVIDTAVFNSHRIEPMDTSRGFGIVGQPFLRDYCEYFYLHILDALPDALGRIYKRRAESLFLQAPATEDILTEPADIARHLGLEPELHGRERPLPDLLVVDHQGRLTPVVTVTIPDPEYVTERSITVPAFAEVATHAPPEILARISHYEVTVGPGFELPRGLALTEEGELWQLVDDTVTPEVWQRVDHGGRPVLFKRVIPD